MDCASREANRPAHRTEVGSTREHVAIVGPYIAFSGLECRRQMHRVGCAYEQIEWSGHDQGTGPPQQSFVNGNELPQTFLHMFEEAGRKFRGVAWRQRALAQTTVDYPMELSQSP